MGATDTPPGVRLTRHQQLTLLELARDAILAHHQIVHTAAPNTSSHIRYATIFRLRHKDCDETGHDAYTDIWREWPGIQAALTEPV